MIYNNLIYLLVVIVIISTRSIADPPKLPLLYTVLLFLVKGALYHWLVHRALARARNRASHYFAAEQRFSILAILFLAVDVYLLGCLYYVGQLPLAGRLPVLVNLGGLLLFFFYLAILWLGSRRTYAAVFDRYHSKGSFLLTNARNFLPLVLPWIILTLISDLFRLFPIPAVQQLLTSSWGEPLVLVIFLLLLAVGFPLIVVRLWNCTPLPPGPLRTHLEHFCKSQGLGYADIMTWPLFEGRLLTAGIMGLVKRVRYLLITPALLQSLPLEEVEAVMAHEIGHVKRFHLQLYLFLFLGFILLTPVSVAPIVYLLLSTDFFYQLLLQMGHDPVAMLGLASAVSLLVMLLLYFRFIFGFFMRNFERQADIHALETMGGGGPIIGALERVALLSGNIRDLPNWHHFSIGQRVDFLARCERQPSLIKRHHRKVYAALALYLVFTVGGLFFFIKTPGPSYEVPLQEKFVSVLSRQIEQNPNEPLLHHWMGDLRYGMGQLDQAVASYEKVLTLQPANGEVLNNLAWLLLTAEPKTLRDPVRALPLAERAASLKPQGHILDTLATAQWANGLRQVAIATENRALTVDPAASVYYRSQIKKFTTEKYRPAVTVFSDAVTQP